MKHDIIISPSILSADFANLENEMSKVKYAGAHWLHIDVMDGHFVPNITIGAPVVKSLNRVSDLVLDVHLMIENPDRYIKDFVDAGGDIITVHYEATGDNTKEILNLIKSYGTRAGLSIKPKTRPEEIEAFIPLADLILVMTVEPGFGGQKFMEDCAQKLPYIKERQKEGQYLQVDGGINDVTAKICKDLGANSLVAGNYIFNAPNINEAVKSLLV